MFEKVLVAGAVRHLIWRIRYASCSPMLRVARESDRSIKS